MLVQRIINTVEIEDEREYPEVYEGIHMDILRDLIPLCELDDALVRGAWIDEYEFCYQNDERDFVNIVRVN